MTKSFCCEICYIQLVIQIFALLKPFFSRTPLIEHEQTKSKLLNRSETIRATNSEVEIGQFRKPTLKAAKKARKKFFDKDIMKMNMTEYINNPHIRSEYANVSNQLINCKQNTTEQFAVLN